jgi:hypothetical protein
MKAFHATPIENKETVIAEGLVAMVTDKITLADEQICAEGVFFFCNIEDAEEFGVDCCGGEYAIFSADVDDYILDPEYDGGAIFVYGSVSECTFETSNV